MDQKDKPENAIAKAYFLVSTFNNFDPKEREFMMNDKLLGPSMRLKNEMARKIKKFIK
jgi:hypothetical protein